MSSEVYFNCQGLDTEYLSHRKANAVVVDGTMTMEVNCAEALRKVGVIQESGEKVNILRKSFGNPAPLALVGFVLSLTPLACDLMGWHGAGDSGAASTGVYFFVGGLLMILGSLGEWVMGKTFPSVVFGTFGAFWAAFGATLVPWFNACGAYVANPTQNATFVGYPGDPLGLQSPAYNKSFAFFLLFMGMMCLIFLICSLRINVAFFVVFFTLGAGFSCLAGAYWNLALAYENGSNLAAAARAASLFQAGGICVFITSLAGWYILLSTMLTVMDFPFEIPLGDLSTMIKGASQRHAVVSPV